MNKVLFAAPPTGSLPEVILRIIDRSVNDDPAKLFNTIYSADVRKRLRDLLIGKSGVSQEWVNQKNVCLRETLRKHFPEGWTSQNEQDFDRAVSHIRESRFGNTNTSPKPKPVRMRPSERSADPREEVARLFKNMRIGAGCEDPEKLAMRVFPQRRDMAERLGRLLLQIERQDPEIPYATILATLERSGAIFGLKPDTPAFESLQEIKARFAQQENQVSTLPGPAPV